MPSLQQQKIYETWLELGGKVKDTAKQLKVQPERVRQAVARVKRHLKDQELSEKEENLGH